MKILHYVHSYDGYSGASKQAIALAKELSLLGCTQKFVSEVSFSNKNGINTSSCIFLSPYVWGVFQFIKVLISFKPDVVHFHGASFKYLPLAALFSSVYWKTTLFGDDDFNSLIKKTSKLKGYVKKKLIGLIDTNNSLTHQNYMENIKYISKNKIVTIPNGVVFERDLIFKKSKIVIIIAVIIPRKRILEAINFFQLNFESLGYKLYVIGPYDNPVLDGFSAKYVERCLSLASESIIFTNKLDSEKIKTYLHSASYLLLFSTFEGMPNVVLEALSNGLIPIVTPMGGVSAEILSDNEDIGLILSEDNISLKTEIPVCDFKSFVRCRSLIERKYAMNIVAKKTFDIYMKIA